LIVIFTANVFADQRPGMRLSIGPYFFKTMYESKYQDVMDSFHTGLAIVGEAATPESGSIEASIVLMKKNYYREASDGYVVESLPRIYLTLGYRYWFFSRLSMAIALGSNYSLGSYTREISFGTGVDGLETSARDTTDYLIDTSLQFIAWKAKTESVIIDVRYAKNFTTRADENANHIASMLLYRKNIGFKPEVKK
jgi:hypothetical protein